MTRTLLFSSVALLLLPTAQIRKPICAPDNAGLTLPTGFCALLVAESIGPSRHIVVLENGDVLVAVSGQRGGIRLLRDTTGDGKADVVSSFGIGGGNGIAFAGEYLYFATNDAVVRWHWQIGQLTPTGKPDTVVSGLTNRREHAAKSIVIGSDGMLYVNIGAPSNSCQVQSNSRVCGRDLEVRSPARRADADGRPTLRHGTPQCGGSCGRSRDRLAVRVAARP